MCPIGDTNDISVTSLVLSSDAPAQRGVGRGGKGLATRPSLRLARTNAGMQARVLECN